MPENDDTAETATTAKGSFISQALDFVKTKPTVEVLLAVIVAGFYYGITYGIPYMLDRMDATLANNEASHLAAQQEVAATFRDTIKELREDRKADRAEYKAERDEFRMWMKENAPRRLGHQDDPPDGFIGLRRHDSAKVKGGVD